MAIDPITQGDPFTQSEDIVARNIEQLRVLFPEAFVEGKIDFDVLRQLLGSALEEREEKYGLTWFGKERARQLARTTSTGTLRPCPADSVDWETTQNIVIEGDNLEVLKLLQKSFAGKVKLIYIDPPYNTGKDFVYPDDYVDGIKNYLKLTGQTDQAGFAVSSNSESSGRFHTAWLNMMYPRLKLARNLLSDDGVILISIDDGEVDNLRKICTEIFGEDNFVTTIIWQKKYSPSNDAKWLSDNHDYLILVAKNKAQWRPRLLPRTEEANARYSNPDGDPRGDWKPSGLDVKTYSEEYDYEITTPSGRIVRPPAGACWRVSKERFAEMVAENRIWFGRNGSNVPAIKRFLNEVKQGITPLTIWLYEEVGHNQEATQELRALGVLGFESTKPVRLLARAIQMCSSNGDVVLDFFAGSGTTGHAAWVQNIADGGSRRFILVQLPEKIDPQNPSQSIAADFCDRIGKPRNIAEITKERLRRASRKIKEETPENNGDLGFRVFKLDASNIVTWDPDRDNLPASLSNSVPHLKEGRSEADILYELLLKRGIDLCAPIETRDINGKILYNVGQGALLVCLAAEITRNDTEPLALGIVKWHKELNSPHETTCVFRDHAFVDDVAKSNLAAILEQNGLLNIRSL